jgi:predicted kinase
VADDEADQRATPFAFAVFHEIVRGRCALRRRTVADATGLDTFARERLRRIAAEFDLPCFAVVFPASVEALLEQNRRRSRVVPEGVVHRHAEQLNALLESGELLREGYQEIRIVLGEEEQG